MLFSIGAGLASLAMLTVAADHLVVGAGRLAERLGMSQVVIGVVVIGLGTSAPELVVSDLAAERGDTTLALSNLSGRTSSTSRWSWASPRSSPRWKCTPASPGGRRPSP